MAICCGDPETEAHMDTHPTSRGMSDVKNVRVSRPKVQE